MKSAAFVVIAAALASGCVTYGEPVPMPLYPFISGSCFLTGNHVRCFYVPRALSDTDWGMDYGGIAGEVTR